MSLYSQMYSKFYGKAVTFEIAEGVYVPGVVESIDDENTDILCIIDKDGKEHDVNLSVRDVILN